MVATITETAAQRQSKRRAKLHYARLVKVEAWVHPLHRALAEAGHWISPSTVYRWHRRPDTKRQDGVIPERFWPQVRAAAQVRGITLEEKT